MMADRIQRLADMMEDAVVWALTGAGISTESGIPDFRSPGGLWEQMDPMEFASREALQQRPRKLWGFMHDTIDMAADAEPNAGHRALAQLEADGAIEGIITQNIDGLHQAGGSENVLEVHGHLRTAHCLDCGHEVPLQEALGQLDGDEIPVCGECGGTIRPDVVLFGDPMAPDFEEAIEAVMSCDLVIAIGSSLTVSPANMLAINAPHLAIINRDDTACDDAAEVVIHASAGETLRALVEAVEG
jgi:NAD-dependent deacetylase